MNEVLTAAFLILIGSQEPCQAGGYGGSIVLEGSGYGVALPLHMQIGLTQPATALLPVPDRASLDRAFQNWLGPSCFHSSEWIVNVLDVKAGKWTAYKQRREQQKREVEEYTGRVFTEPAVRR